MTRGPQSGALRGSPALSPHSSTRPAVQGPRAPRPRSPRPCSGEHRPSALAPRLPRQPGRDRRVDPHLHGARQPRARCGLLGAGTQVQTRPRTASRGLGQVGRLSGPGAEPAPYSPRLSVGSQPGRGRAAWGVPWTVHSVPGRSCRTGPPPDSVPCLRPCHAPQRAAKEQSPSPEQREGQERKRIARKMRERPVPGGRGLGPGRRGSEWRDAVSGGPCSGAGSRLQGDTGGGPGQPCIPRSDHPAPRPGDHSQRPPSGFPPSSVYSFTDPSIPLCGLGGERGLSHPPGLTGTQVTPRPRSVTP